VSYEPWTNQFDVADDHAFSAALGAMQGAGD
jgi:hypothetical protein